MKIIYYPESDTLNITLTGVPYEPETGLDTEDPDVTLILDSKGRIAEIEIEHASRRCDLDLLKHSPAYTVSDNTQTVLEDRSRL